MYVFETYNPIKDETDVIASDNVVELCERILNYNNNIDDNTHNEHTVSFNDIDGNNIIVITEDGLYFAITGTIKNEGEITDTIKSDSQKFWEITHSNVKHISFTNPVRMGDAEWDEDYDESENDSDDSDESDSEYEYESNIVNSS